MQCTHTYAQFAKEFFVSFLFSSLVGLFRSKVLSPSLSTWNTKSFLLLLWKIQSSRVIIYTNEKSNELETYIHTPYTNKFLLAADTLSLKTAFCCNFLIFLVKTNFARYDSKCEENFFRYCFFFFQRSHTANMSRIYFNAYSNWIKPANVRSFKTTEENYTIITRKFKKLNKTIAKFSEARAHNMTQRRKKPN